MARKKNAPAQGKPTKKRPAGVALDTPPTTTAERIRFLQLAAKVASPTEEMTSQEAEEFFRLLPKYGRYEVDGINPPGGKRVPVANTHYIVLTGKSATVCPRAKPQLGVKLASAIADSLRGRGLIQPDQTIHYVGYQAEPDAICECDLAAGALPNANEVKPHRGIRGEGAQIIISLGEKKYRIGAHPPVHLEDNEDSVLQALLEAPGNLLDKKGLINKSGIDDAPRVLGRITRKHDRIFATAIRCPGKRGAGGYHANIRAAAEGKGGTVGAKETGKAPPR
jgi:hypothetical protein